LAYRGIKELQKRNTRKATEKHISIAQNALRSQYSHAPTAATIWKSLRRKDITRQIRTFLWKWMHGAHRIGKFWKNIPGYEEREICRHCNVTEDLEHILLHSTKPGQAQIWKLAEEFWAEKHGTWPPLSLGNILGSGLAKFEDEKRRPVISNARLYRIIMTESMYLIWKLRCESVIQRDGQPPAENEVVNRWVHMMNERIDIDKV
ncbi:hypothetical protein B0H19DRAFT_939935, partial [Mycena capillaripes]